MSAPVENLLARLDGVRQTGPYRWLAKCPSHDDRSPSLSVAENDTGAALVHCHGGCSVHEVLSALHLEMHELFPPTDRDRDGYRTRPKLAIPAADIIKTLATEALVVVVVASDMARGVAPDRERLMQAAHRFLNAYDLVADRKLSQAEKHQLLTREEDHALVG